jgi:nucleoside-diphosphate-sugar epimerase
LGAKVGAITGNPPAVKILVTGASGTIGLAVTEKLVSANHEVIGYDRVGSELNGASLIEGDVRDFAHLTEAARGCEAGIHLAAVADGATVSDILSINALGAYGFLAAAKEVGFRRTIIAGSAPVHLPASDRDNGLPPPSSDGEDHVYDLSKALQEVIADDFRSHGLTMLCLRFGHVVRGKEETNLEGSLALEDEYYCRGGWVALEDIAEACLAGLALQPSEDALEILNIVGAKGARERFRVAAAEERLGVTLQYDFAAYEPAAPAESESRRSQ